MARHQKELTKKQKIIRYVSCAMASAVAAVGAVILVVHLVKNPPDIIFNSNSASYISSLSMLSTQDVVYIPQTVITVTPDGTQQKIEKIVEAAEQVESTRKNKVIVQNYAVDKSGFIKNKVQLPVEYLSQYPELPTGCEITSLTTVLNFYGYDISKVEMSDKYLDKTIDKIGDFFEVFVGDPRENGFGCYAKPVVNAANRYFADVDSNYKAVDKSGTKFEDLLKLVENDTPVIIWGTMYGEKEKTLREPYTTVQWNIDGKDLQWIAPEHCMVLIGYDLDRNVAIMSDPQRGIVEYDLDTVKARYLALHSQCVVIEEIPVVTGVTDGATYYTTQCVTVSSYNLASVTLDGVEVESVFLISGNSQDTHHIVVTDLNGATTEVTVYTLPIMSMLDSLGGINEYTATLDDRDSLLAVKALAQSVETRYSPIKESSAVEDVIYACDFMLESIEETVTEIERLKAIVAELENKELTASDLNTLTQLSEDISALTAKKALTDEQHFEINDISIKCQKWFNDLTQ